MSVRVKVLHFINPFLIWVELIDMRTKKKVVFEQVGIFGLIPLTVAPPLNGQMSMEYDLTKVSKLIDPHFKNAEMWFTPKETLQGFSLFNNNLHKFGNLTAVYPDGTIVDIRNELLSHHFAIYNEALYLTCAIEGSFKPRLHVKLAGQTCFSIEEACPQGDVALESLWLRIFRKKTSRVRIGFAVHCLMDSD